MSKHTKQSAKPEEPKIIKVISFAREEGHYCMTEWEIDEELLNKHAKPIYKSLPDIMSVFSGQVVSKMLDIFGL